MNFANLGVAMGAGVQEWNNQRKMSRDDAAEARAQQQFDWQKGEHERKLRIQTDQDAMMEEARQHAGYINQLQATPDDQLGTFASGLIEKYNKHPAYANGLFANMSTVDGKPVIVHGNMAKLGGVQTIPVTREMLQQGLDHMGQTLRQRLAMTSPEGYTQYADKQQDIGLKNREIATKERSNEIADAHYTRSDATMDNYRSDQSALIQEQIRTGNFGALGLHRAQAGYYDRMPKEGGGGGALAKDPTRGIIGFDEKSGAIWRVTPDGKIATEVLRDEAGNPVPTAIVRGLFQGGHNKVPTPAKPVLPFDKFLEAFPPKKGETEEAALRRYNRFLDPSTGQGGLAALSQVDGGRQVAPQRAAPPPSDPAASYNAQNRVALTSNDPATRLQAQLEYNTLLRQRDQGLGLPPRADTSDWLYRPK